MFKKIATLFSCLTIVLSSFLIFSVIPARADVADITIWNMKGTYGIDLTCTAGCSGVYSHTMNITSSDDNTGNFSGTGFYNTDHSYTWNITGNVNGNLNSLTFDVIYTGSNPGYTLHGTGQINSDGTLSGTATSNSAQSFNFQSTSGKAKHERIHVNQEVSKKQCDTTGKAVVNVTEKIINDADSGFAGYWAMDQYTRHIKVWQTGTNTFCADLSYDGTFNAFAGKTGPAGTGTIGSNVDGNFSGGYRSTQFTGTFAPTWSTSGSVGTVDYQCDMNGNCSNLVDWTSKYFSSTSGFYLAWWGWTYKANGHHGTWINAVNGNSGNIL